MIMKDLSSKKDSKSSSFIRLSLRKPKDWNVALTTSVSSPAIIPPDIQLWDAESGNIIANTSGQRINYARSNLHSFGKSAESVVKERNISSKHRSNSDKINKSTIISSQVGGRYIRSKSSSGRVREDLVSPSDYVKPKTPAMVARRVSLSKDNYDVSHPEEPTVQPSGIVTHHRKMHSDSLVDMKRRVKRNVSFGKVDHIEESGSVSMYNSQTIKDIHQKRNSVARSSSSGVVITEVCNYDDYRPTLNSTTNERNAHKVKYRSRSGNHTQTNNRRDSFSEGVLNNGYPLRSSIDPSIIVNGYSYRRSRMELHMQEGSDKHRFNVVRVSDSGNQSSRPPSTSYIEQNRHNDCDRGFCPLVRYFDHTSLVQDSLRKVELERNKSRNSWRDSTYGGSGNAVISSADVKVPRAERVSRVRERVVSKGRKKRVPSRNREMMMSSSSSEAEDHGNARTPPRRMRRSKPRSGDRLVGVNGQCVRSPSQAEELVRASPDLVSLQLRRHGVVSQSLPRRPLSAAPAAPRSLADMGSNMSRHSGKGLTGRRSQSQGNLCNGKAAPLTGVARIFSPCGRENVGPRDRYKFCGSLPNHLDAEQDNNNVRKSSDVLLRLAGPPAAVAMDQGYASERSPEDEPLPALPLPLPEPPIVACPVHNPAADKPAYPFLHNNSTFTVRLTKGSRGLGLSVTGGVDSQEPWPGLVRVKRLFPHQPAWASGQLANGDFLLVANNTSLVGLSNYEALEVLRTAPTEVVLTVCRPPPELKILSASQPPADAPPPPRRDPNLISSLQLPLKRMESFGEFELTLKKVNGSLGFTLRKEDESVLGHYVRALVREPALSDGRVKPGDKIVTVNGVDMSPMSHEEAVLFLRQCGQEVHLKLYRDPAQTPVQALSPTEHHRTFKPILRKEAQDMLSDLAVKKSLSPNESSGSSTLSSAGRTSSPRKRRLTKTPSPDHFKERPDNHLAWSDEVLERVTPRSEADRLRRPDSLNFCAERKPQFQFSAVGPSKTEESLNSLDSLECCGSMGALDSEVGVGPLPLEPVSMPPLLTSTSDTTIGFSYRNPAYRSANPAPSKSKTSLAEELLENRCSDNDLTGAANTEGSVEGSKGLLKWKNVLFTPEDGVDTTATSPDDSISQITEVDNNTNQVLVVELNRGWNSRLGFSLQQSGRSTHISAIHSDSVASRDGRLRSGDQLIMVNDESVEGMSTTEVINLLRKIRGIISITVWRNTT